MKKNKMMRAASFLLVAVLLTTSVISGTFAKYVTTATGSDSARVAKWGVTITANGTTFADAYATHDGAHVTAFANSVITSGSTGDAIVAPGTSGNMASMTLSGTPEVAVKVTYEADLVLSGNWTVDGGAFYCPLKFNVEGTVVDSAGCADAAEFEDKVENLINGWTKVYAAKTDLSSVADDSVSVYWEWPFSTSEANDVKDTFLGGQAAAGNPATVTLTIKTTVTQVD